MQNVASTVSRPQYILVPSMLVAVDSVACVAVPEFVDEPGQTKEMGCLSPCAVWPCRGKSSQSHVKRPESLWSEGNTRSDSHVTLRSVDLSHFYFTTTMNPKIVILVLRE